MGTLTITKISLKDHRFAQVLTHTYENKSQELKKKSNKASTVIRRGWYIKLIRFNPLLNRRKSHRYTKKKAQNHTRWAYNIFHNIHFILHELLNLFSTYFKNKYKSRYHLEPKIKKLKINPIIVYLCLFHQNHRNHPNLWIHHKKIQNPRKENSKKNLQS